MRDRGLDRLFERFRRRGDVEALGQVFDLAAPELLRIARHLVGNSADAEDLVQSTFVTAIERASDFDRERRLVPWLVGILAHHAANARRKRSGSDELGDEPALSADASQVAQERELRSKLRAIVGELPDVLREVVARHLIHGKQPQEIALELGLSPGATRVRLHRGLERVRRALPLGFATGAIAVSVTSSRGLAAVRSEVLACAHSAAPMLASSMTSSATSIWLGGSLVLQRFVLAAAAVAVIAGSIWFFAAGPRGSSASSSVSASASPLDEAGMLERASARLDPRAEDASRELVATERGVLFEGRVVDDATNEPLAGARVWTIPAGSRQRVERATSVADGTFEFRAIAAEEPTLFVEADGYAPTRPPLSEKSLADFHAKCEREVLDGGARVKLYELRLARGVAFEGRVVLAADRSPVADAQLVLAWRDMSMLSVVSEHVVGRTDALGAMHFDGLLPAIERSNDGKYVLFALADAGAGWTFVARPGGRAAMSGIEIAIEPQFELEVQVRDESGAAVAGASVHVAPTHSPFHWLPTGQYGDSVLASLPLSSCFEATTDVDGIARLRRLPPPPADAQRDIAPSSFLVFAEAAGVGATRQFRQFEAARSGKVELVLAHDTTTRIRGRVVDVHGLGIEGARVRMYNPKRDCTSGVDGAYELARLATDPVRVEILTSKPGWTTSRRNIDRAEFGGVIEQQDFVLRPALAIAGRVIDESGVPLAGLQVYAFDPDNQWARTPENAPTTADGSFRIEDSGEGEWSLYPVHLGADSPPQLANIVWPSDGVHARGGDRNVEIVLHRREPRPGRLEVEVIDADTGAALDAIRASAFAIDNDEVALEERLEPGKVVCDGIAPGRYAVWISVAGRSSGMCEVELAPDEQVARGRIEIARPARVHGRVNWSRFAGALAAEVEGHLGRERDVVPGNFGGAGSTAFEVRARLAPDGSFEFSNLTAGLWRVRVVAEGVRPLEYDVELRPDEDAGVVLTPEPGAVIEFVASASPKRGWIGFELADANGTWREFDGSWNATRDPLPPMRVTAHPGHVRWRAWFTKDENIHDDDHVAQPREGELDIAAGQVVRVPLEVVLVE